MSKVKYDVINVASGRCNKCGKELRNKRGYIKKSTFNTLSLGVMSSPCCSITCFNAKYN